jgi:acyl-CoA reductase-like NAD-dependent aldehyde dehydrogenase
MKLFLAGQWRETSESLEVRSPYDQTLVDTVPITSEREVERALSSAVRGAAEMAKLSAYDRYEILSRAAVLLRERQETLAHTLTRESGKILAEAMAEVLRAADTLEWSAEEAKRLRGEVLPLDAVSHGAGKFGFTLRVPCGIVVAIAPFNFPLNLPCHKLGPALAGGNAVILKPASVTPLSALNLVQVLLDAGLPELGIQCLVGQGGKVGTALCKDQRVRKISFTGSRDVGEQIMRSAGLKRVTMELGSNSPVIVLDDADLDLAAQTISTTGYANAGQVCISAQRIITTPGAHDALLDKLVPKVRALTTGDPLKAETKMGPLIRVKDAERVAEWIDEAKSAGAEVLTGGKRDGALYSPTIVSNVQPAMRVAREELFGPAVAVLRADSVEAALALANDSRYGLSAAIFTRDLNRAMQFAKHAESGNIHINGGPQWRADFMPYGGLKESGFGKEGPSYAIQEMTELKMVVIHGIA